MTQEQELALKVAWFGLVARKYVQRFEMAPRLIQGGTKFPAMTPDGTMMMVACVGLGARRLAA